MHVSTSGTLAHRTAEPQGRRVTRASTTLIVFLAPVVAREMATGGTDANIEVGSANMTRSRAIADFDVHVVPVDITKTQLLENALRQVDESWAVKQFKEMFQDKMYGMNDTKISVALIGLETWAAVAAVMTKYQTQPGFSVDKYFPENVAAVIDGQHRRHVLMLDDVRATNGDIVLAKLYTRKDGVRYRSGLSVAGTRAEPHGSAREGDVSAGSRVRWSVVHQGAPRFGKPGLRKRDREGPPADLRER